MLRNLFNLPRRLSSRPRRRQATRRRALADRLPWIEPLEGRLLLATDVWTGADAFNNNWSDRNNWSIGVPQAGDEVVFSATPNSIYGSVDDIPFTGSMVVDSSWGGSIQVGYPQLSVPMTLTNLSFASGSLNVYSPLSVNYLNLSGGTINNSAATSMTLNGLSDGDSGQWTGGTINLGGSLINNGTFTLGSPTGSGTLSLTGTAPLINQGTMIQAGTYNLVLDSFSQLDNQENYTFQDNGTITSSFVGGYAGIVTNSGTIRKAGGTGNSLISTVINNYSGTLDVETGTLTLQPHTNIGLIGSMTGGTFDVVAGAVLDLTGGSSAGLYTGTYTGSGAGVVSLNSGTLAIGQGGATFNFPPGLFQWSGGTIDVSNGSLANTGSLTITGDGTQEVLTSGGYSPGALINQGTIVQDDLSNLTVTLAAELRNQGSYTFQGDGSISGGNIQGYVGILTNSGSGMITKAAGTGTSTISCPWANTGGTINVQTGTISLATPSGVFQTPVANTSTGGTFNVAAGAVLDLTGGVTAGYYTGTYTGSGPGTISLKNGTLAIGNGGATFNFPAGLFQWSGGTIDVSNGSLTNTGSLTITGDRTQEDLYGGGGSNALINQGAIVQDDLSNLTLTVGLAASWRTKGAIRSRATGLSARVVPRDVTASSPTQARARSSRPAALAPRPSPARGPTPAARSTSRSARSAWRRR